METSGRTLLDRQAYKDVTISEAVTAGCDIVQLKYDGWWTRMESNNGTLKMYSRTARLFKETDLSENPKATIIGEHMQGTQWSQQPGRIGRTFIFDIWKFRDLDLTNVPYSDRYRIAKLLPTYILPETFELVANYPIASAQELWSNQVEAGDFEGLVFRRSSDLIASCLYRCKKTICEDLTCVGFIEGKGKYVGTLGAMKGVTASGVFIDVGGGYSDDDRDEIWNHQDFYRGKQFEVEARAKFESGSLRHPNFVKWRMDKL